jgi:hypothetical protein
MYGKDGRSNAVTHHEQGGELWIEVRNTCFKSVQHGSGEPGFEKDMDCLEVQMARL